MKRKKLPVLLAALLLLSGCGKTVQNPKPVPTVDPYAGMVQADSGYGMKIWVKEYDDVPVNPLRAVNLSQEGDVTDENGVRYELRRGIDVSEHQGAIDWDAVAENAPDFVIIRAGYRGYGEAGRLCEDAFFRDNVDGALRTGIPVGLYFFSQAITPEEAEEEAEFLLRQLEPYAPEDLALPVFFDWEDIDFDEARTNGLDGETLTDCAAAFCRRMEQAGYTAGVYTYRTLGYFRYDLSRLTDFPLWFAGLGNCPDFYYAFDLWQYSTVGEIPGIEGPVDMDMIFVPADGE